MAPFSFFAQRAACLSPKHPALYAFAWIGTPYDGGSEGYAMNDTISARELASAWDAYGPDTEVLSLDCFDTLVWRDAATPSDVFCELTPPVTRAVRVVGERAARARARALTGRGEVRLRDIYRCALPGAEQDAIDARVAEELELEKRFCRAFAPAVELIRSAKAAGKRVIVVSDTYLDARQLAALIDAAAGAPLTALIDALFCSCEYGVSKTEGLFGHVLRRLRIAPQRVLHVGDNPAADLEAPRALGMRALQLVPGDAALCSQWRMESAALLMAEPSLRQSRAPRFVYRRLLASGTAPEMSAAERLGYGSLGPLMHAFAAWVRDEARALAARGGPVKVCFLMRDGYLPLLTYRRLAGADDPPAFALEVSRFSAIAGSLCADDDVLDYFALVEEGMSPEAIGRQLLLTPQEVERLAPNGVPERGARLRRAVLRPRTLREIVNRSRLYRQRLFAHLVRAVEPRPGDTVMLVDLGYAGTAQNRLQDLIEREFGVSVTGRYLLLRDVPRGSDRKRGFFGPDRLDARALETLVSFVAALEQACTAQTGSVIDYSTDGEPLRKPRRAAAAGDALRAEMQRGCLRFVSDAARFDASAAIDGAGRWQAALAACARLLLLPARTEAECLAALAHDVNLGAADTVPLVDPRAGREDLLRLGSLYLRTAPRAFASAELRAAGLDAAFAHLARSRFDVDLRVSDLYADAIDLPVMVARNGKVAHTTVPALPTHEGFYAASIPVGRGEYAVGVLFGARFEWLQLESARLATARHQFEALYREGEVDLTAAAAFEGLRAHAGGLLQCLTEHAFAYFEPPAARAAESCVLRVVFRPLAMRDRAGAARAIATAAASAAST